MSIQLKKRDKAYLCYLASTERPRSFSPITAPMLIRLEAGGMIECDPRTMSRPNHVMRWWRITDKGRAFVCENGCGG